MEDKSTVVVEKRSTATIRERGQVTIPADVRKQAHLGEGAIVEFEVLESGGVVLRPKIVIADLEVDDDFLREVIASTTSGYEMLREDDEAWQEELAERAVLETSLPDALEDQ